MNARALRFWAITAIGVQCALLAFAIAGTHGWIVKLPQTTTTDFVSFYAAGKLAAGANPAAVYDLIRHQQAEFAATGSSADYKFFFYPPVFLLLLAPLAKLPYLAAFVCFQVVPLAALIWALRLTAPRWSAWAILAVPSLYWCLGQGQNSLLSAALFAIGIGLLERWPGLAGIAFGMLCYKPHLGIVLPFALLAGRHWRSLVASGITVIALIFASYACFGAGCWIAFWQRFATTGAVFTTGRVNFGALTSVFGAALNLGASATLAGCLQIIATLAAIFTAMVIWRRRGSLACRGASLIAATLIAMPVVLYYDLTIAALPAIWLAASPAAGRRLQTALITSFAIDLIGYPVAVMTHLSVAAAICPTLLWLAAAWSKQTPEQYAVTCHHSTA